MGVSHAYVVQPRPMAKRALKCFRCTAKEMSKVQGHRVHRRRPAARSVVGGVVHQVIVPSSYVWDRVAAMVRWGNAVGRD